MALNWIRTTTGHSGEALMAEFNVPVERKRGHKGGRRGPLRGSSPGRFTAYVERDPVIMRYTEKGVTVTKSRNWTLAHCWAEGHGGGGPVPLWTRPIPALFVEDGQGRRDLRGELHARARWLR